MSNSLGEALTGFSSHLERLRQALAADPVVSDTVFADADAWLNLLRYKLVPHLAGEGCLVAAVTGGTNTGKSTVFNLLLHQGLSPVVATAAATRHPVIAANARRAAQCLEGKLVPEFHTQPLDDPQAVVGHEAPPDALFVAEVTDLPDRLVLLDTPDVDSIDKANWTVAENIRAAGDVLIAVVTGEKYRDDRVVAFFRRAAASGRVIIPLMNKANPENDFKVAREQLAAFTADVGIESPTFAVAHDFATAHDFARTIVPLDGRLPLREYLEQLNTAAIKRRVYRDTVRHFAEQAGAFLEQAAHTETVLRDVAAEVVSRTAQAAHTYDPAPGPAVGGLFHSFVQQKRGAVRRFIGAASSRAARTAAGIARTLTASWRKRATLDTLDEAKTEAELQATHALAIEQITRNLASALFEMAPNLREPAAHLLQEGLKSLDAERAVGAVKTKALRGENLSEDFRRHAMQTLEAWWNDNPYNRRALEALDTLLSVVPAAIAVPLSMHTAGFGVPETVVFVSPIVEQFFARVVEYQFGDKMFDLLSPWRKEQRDVLERALREEVTDVALARLRPLLDALSGPSMEQLGRWQQQCLSRSETS